MSCSVQAAMGAGIVHGASQEDDEPELSDAVKKKSMGDPLSDVLFSLYIEVLFIPLDFPGCYLTMPLLCFA